MILWTDLETTGLYPKHDQILEAAAVLTDDDLLEVARFHAVIGYERNHLRMTEWCWKQHSHSGLLEEVFTSGLSIEALEAFLVAFIQEHTEEKPVLGGSTISFDRGFMNQYLPAVVNLIHYRNIDISSLVELHRRWKWKGEVPKKREIHRAIPDVEDTLTIARFFKQAL